MATGMTVGFDCIAASDAKILILGSMPSVASLQQQQYYAHPRNCFWDIIESLFAIERHLSYQTRLRLLQEQRIALWDVVHRCQRIGSLDSNIERVVVNDFSALFCHCPDIQQLFFNGRKAAELYHKKVLPQLNGEVQKLERTVLPSTSPAHAALSKEKKLYQWRTIKQALGG